MTCWGFQNLPEFFDFWVHLSTFGAENTDKSGPFKTKKDAQTIPKKPQNNFEEAQKTIFSIPKIAKHYPSKRSKMLNFLMNISIFGSFIDLWSWKYSQK